MIYALLSRSTFFRKFILAKIAFPATSHVFCMYAWYFFSPVRRLKKEVLHHGLRMIQCNVIFLAHILFHPVIIIVIVLIHLVIVLNLLVVIMLFLKCFTDSSFSSFSSSSIYSCFFNRHLLFPSSGFLLQAELRRWEEGARWVAGLQTKTKTNSIFNVCSWSWSHCCIAIVRQRKCRLMIVKVLWSRSHYYVKKNNACDCSSIG